MKQKEAPKTVLAQVEQLQVRAVQFDEQYSNAHNAFHSLDACLHGKKVPVFHPFSWFYYTRH